MLPFSPRGFQPGDIFKAKEYELTGAAFGIPVFVLVLGIVVLLIGFLGCCGAWKLNKCFLRLFAFLVGVLVIAEIVCGALLFVYKEKVKDYVKSYFASAISEVQDIGNPKVETAVTKLQQELKCCGANGPSDWKNATKYCCPKGETNCTTTYFTQGCVDVIYDLLKNNLVGVAITVIVLGIIEIGAIVAAVFLAKKATEL
ncbi:unnamed protein product [Mesocestoides corti]|uniref:Tetraspanin n=1 Tax=Mesocestoides corti TaxID=53468 RepID=A0A0R3UE43_MESCO|nr:unnamed protein product [Mesocestoides corti]